MRKYLFNRQHARGMTLVELLLVMGILSIVMLAVMSLYVPAHQSTVAQSQVSDVQSNLRLALKTMTRDLLIAGFLMPYDPIAFPDADPNYYDDMLTSPGTPDSQDFIIRTRAVGSDFARVLSVADVSGDLQLTVSDSEMVSRFPDGSRVRLFEPMTGDELIKDTGTSASRAYTVQSTGSNTITINKGALSTSDVLKETVVIRVRDENQPALQTIRYHITDGALERVVNDSVQYLARNVDTNPANSNFSYEFSPQGRVIRVDITLTGKTQALKNDAISGEKTREISTSVKLRNIN